MRIGTKKLSYLIEIQPKQSWHTGVATLCIWKMRYYEEMDGYDGCDGWFSNNWWFIPIFGKEKRKDK